MSAIEKRALSADLPAPTLPKPPFARPTVQFPGQAQRQAESQQHDFDEIAPRTVPVNVMRSTPPVQAPAPVRPQAVAPAPVQPFSEPQAYQAPESDWYSDQQYGDQQYGEQQYGATTARLGQVRSCPAGLRSHDPAGRRSP